MHSTIPIAAIGASLAVLVCAILLKKSVYRDTSVVLAGAIMIGAAFVNHLVAGAVLFGFLGGSVMQPLLADTYLVSKTLNYRDGDPCLFSTPWWMAVLWGIAMAHLVLAWALLDYYLDTQTAYPIFVIGGALYFYAFEVLVNNHAKWWTRRNCRQPFGVALYATVAETLAVAVLPMVTMLIVYAPLDGVVYGVVVAILFRTCCKLAHRATA